MMHCEALNWSWYKRKVAAQSNELLETTIRPVDFIYFANLVEQKPNNTESKTSIIPCK